MSNVFNHVFYFMIDTEAGLADRLQIMARYLYTGENSQAVQENLFCGMISAQVV